MGYISIDRRFAILSAISDEALYDTRQVSRLIDLGQTQTSYALKCLYEDGHVWKTFASLMQYIGIERVSMRFDLTTFWGYTSLVLSCF